MYPARALRLDNWDVEKSGQIDEEHVRSLSRQRQQIIVKSVHRKDGELNSCDIVSLLLQQCFERFESLQVGATAARDGGFCFADQCNRDFVRRTVQSENVAFMLGLS